MGTHEAWLCLRGLKTLHLRMERHARNALAVAEFLQDHPKVEKVNYPGLASHPQHDVARRQMSGYSGMLSFEVKGGLEAGRKLMNSLELCSLAVSLGSVDTLIEHPASMTHAVMPREMREKAGDHRWPGEDIGGHRGCGGHRGGPGARSEQSLSEKTV